jgi:hypothetical protein
MLSSPTPPAGTPTISSTGIGWSDNDFDGRRTRRVYSLRDRRSASRFCDDHV